MTFNETIWRLCKNVPRGKVTTYKLLAQAAGTTAYRAVGNAMNKNPNGMTLLEKGSIEKRDMVPCHRVVDSSGHLHGFAHGLAAKARLLRKEGVRIKNERIEEFEKMLYRF